MGRLNRITQAEAVLYGEVIWTTGIAMKAEHDSERQIVFVYALQERMRTGQPQVERLPEQPFQGRMRMRTDDEVRPHANAFGQLDCEQTLELSLVLSVQKAGQGLELRLLISVYGGSIHGSTRQVYESSRSCGTRGVKELLRRAHVDVEHFVCRHPHRQCN